MIGNVSNYTQTSPYSSTSSTVTAAPVQTSGPTNEQPLTPQFLDLSQYNLGIGSVPYFRASDINWGPYENNPAEAIKAWQGYLDSLSDDLGRLPRDWESVLKTETLPGRYESDVWTAPTQFIKPELTFRGNPSDYGDWGTSVFGNPANWTVLYDKNNPNAMEFMVKTGNKEGTIIPYIRQGDTWVPQTQGIRKQYWDTNNSAGNLALATVIGLPFLFGGLASAGLIGGGEATAGIGAGEALGSGGLYSAEAFPIAAPGASVTSELPPLAEIGAGGSGAAAGSEMVGFEPWIGLEQSPAIPDPWFTEPGFAPPISATPPPVTDPWFTEPGFEPPITGNPTTPGIEDLIRRIGQVDNVARRLIGGTGGGNQMGNAGGNANGLLGLLSALYGARQSREYADILRQIAGQMQEQASPYINKLRESYENPNAYLESPEMQAVLNLEANRLAGIDASQGRLSNDINRTAKLQQLAQSHLGEYRRGLQQSIEKMYQPMATASLFREAAGRQANAWQGIPQFFGAGGSISNVWNDISNIIKTGKDIWDVISGWWD